MQRKVPPRIFYAVAGFLDPPREFGRHIRIHRYRLGNHVIVVAESTRNGIDIWHRRIDIWTMSLHAQFAFYDPGIRSSVLPRAILRLPGTQTKDHNSKL